MVRFAAVLIAALLTTASCAHTAESHANGGEQNPPGLNTKHPPEWFRKFDPTLRWLIQSKTDDSIDALVRLNRPLSKETLAELERSGLRVHSVQDNHMHVTGDAQALLLLAARSEVDALAASRPMRPSAGDTR
jgi:hypothetical protein